MSEINEKQMIVIKQLPVIEGQLLAFKEKFQAELDEILSLPCNEDTVKIIKKKRAEINKIYSAVEEKRKAAKKAILAPYNEFEALYNECVEFMWSDFDKTARLRIAEVENAEKERKRAEVKAYFDELAEAYELDFVAFEDMDLKITLSESVNKLKSKVDELLGAIQKDVYLINMQEETRDEVMYEYKKTLSLAEALTAVSERRKALTEAQSKHGEEKETEKRIREVEALAAPVVTPLEEEDTKIYQTPWYRFFGTREQIKEFKNIIERIGITYEQQ